MTVLQGLIVEKRTKRVDIIVDIVNQNSTRIDKTTDELLEMSYDDLRDYFRNRRVSRTELLKLLMQFDIQSMYGEKGNLIDFAAREISDVGMYQRVARGARNR